MLKFGSYSIHFRSGFDRLPQWTSTLPLLLLLPLSIVYWIYLNAAAVGVFHDDGIYVATARSLAETGTYRLINLPSEIPQTKYPVLYPAALATLTKIHQRFPDNQILFRLLSLVGAVASVMLILQVARLHGLTASSGRWVALLWLASPWVVVLSTSVMPDTLFVVCVLGSLMWAHRSAEEADERSVRAALIAGTLAGAAMLLRTVGVTLVVSVAVLAYRRRWRKAAVLLTVAAAFAIPWRVWQSANPERPDPVERYYTHLNYSDGRLITSADEVVLAGPIAFNLLQQFTSLATLTGIGTDLSGLAGSIAIWTVGLSGLYRAAKTQMTVYLAWVLVYLAAISVWAWPPHRYLVPVFPLVLLFVAQMTERWAPASRKRIAALSVIVGVTVVGSVVTLSWLATETQRSQWPTVTVGTSDDWSATIDGLHWLRDHTPDNAIVGANLDPMVFLFSGRKAIRLFYADPVVMFYGSDPEGGALGGAPRLRQHLRRHRIDYVLLTPMVHTREGFSFRKDLAAVMLRSPQGFEVMPWFRHPGYAILRVHLEKLAN